MRASGGEGMRNDLVNMRTSEQGMLFNSSNKILGNKIFIKND